MPRVDGDKKVVKLPPKPKTVAPMTPSSLGLVRRLMAGLRLPEDQDWIEQDLLAIIIRMSEHDRLTLSKVLDQRKK